MQKVSTREKEVVIVPSLGSHFNLLAKWTVICDLVLTFYFSIASGLLLAEPRPILLNNV